MRTTSLWQAQVETRPLSALQTLPESEFRLLSLWQGALPPAKPPLPSSGKAGGSSVQLQYANKV